MEVKRCSVSKTWTQAEQGKAVVLLALPRTTVVAMSLSVGPVRSRFAPSLLVLFPCTSSKASRTVRRVFTAATAWASPWITPAPLRSWLAPWTCVSDRAAAACRARRHAWAPFEGCSCGGGISKDEDKVVTLRLVRTKVGSPASTTTLACTTTRTRTTTETKAREQNSTPCLSWCRPGACVGGGVNKSARESWRCG